MILDTYFQQCTQLDAQLHTYMFKHVCRELPSFPELNIFCMLFQVFCEGYPIKFKNKGIFVFQRFFLRGGKK